MHSNYKAIFGAALVVGALVVFLGAVAPSEAANGSLPDAVVRGLDALRLYGPEAAMTAWMRDSPIAGSQAVLEQTTALKGAVAPYGNGLGYQLIHTKTLTPRTGLYYLSLEFERGPVFCRLLAYQSKSASVVVGIAFDTDPTKLLPQELLSQQE
jgi:hypothetical protein